MEAKLIKWEGLIKTWNELGPSFEIRYLPYEELTSQSTGPVLVQSLADELRRAGSAVTNESAACLWQRVVRDKPRKRRNRTYEPSFTESRRNNMVTIVERLLSYANGKENLVPILRAYRDDILKNTPLDKRVVSNLGIN